MEIFYGKGMVAVMMETIMKDVNTTEEIVVDQISILLIAVYVNV